MPSPNDLAKLRALWREQGQKIRAAERAAGVTAGDKHRLAMAERSRKLSKQSAEIGPPPARDEERYERYRFDLFRFLSECFPLSTSLTPLSLDHKRIAERLQEIFLAGGRDLVIMPRGFAKSTLVENACVWAAGYGHQPFIVPISATVDLAKSALDSIQFEFETSDELLALFPAACHAARGLEGVAQRARKQTIAGQLTYIEWNRKRCVLPTVPGFEGSGSIIWPRAILSVRGMRFKRPDGRQQRPTLVFGDDLQTPTSAANPKTCAKILKTLTNTVLRLAGPRSTLAVAIAGTVLEPDDAIDQLSDAKRFPQWRTTKVPMLKSFAQRHDEEWLGKYAEIRHSFNPEDDVDRRRAAQAAKDYYAVNRARMDEGAEAAWENCFDPSNEISAIQHAYNILVDDGEDAFMAECQGQPLKDPGALEMLTVDQICRKQWEFERGQFPKETSVLVAHVDVHRGILYAEVWGYEPGGRGGRVDDPHFPDQRRKYFGHRSIRRRLKHLFPGLDDEATVEAGLDAFLHGYHGADARDNWPGLMRKTWKREDGVPMKLRCCLVDANGEYRDTIAKVVSRSLHSANLHPSYGRGITATKSPISAWLQSREQKGVGPEWVFTKPRAGEIQGITFDSNFYKSKFHRGLALPRAAQGSLSLPRAKNPNDHRMTAEHYTAEKGTEVTADGRTVTEFSQKPNTDNHKLDNAVGCLVAAARCGITSVKSRPIAKRKKRRTYYG